MSHHMVDGESGSVMWLTTLDNNVGTKHISTNIEAISAVLFVKEVR